MDCAHLAARAAMNAPHIASYATRGLVTCFLERCHEGSVNHKRGRPRQQRGSKKMCRWCDIVSCTPVSPCNCKPWKISGIPSEHRYAERHSDHTRRKAASEQLREVADPHEQNDDINEWCGCSECWAEAIPEVHPLLAAFDPRFLPLRIDPVIETNPTSRSCKPHGHSAFPSNPRPGRSHC